MRKCANGHPFGHLAGRVVLAGALTDPTTSTRRLLRRYADAGVDRVMTLVRAGTNDDGALDRFAEDCVAAGAALG